MNRTSSHPPVAFKAFLCNADGVIKQVASGGPPDCIGRPLLDCLSASDLPALRQHWHEILQ